MDYNILIPIVVGITLVACVIGVALRKNKKGSSGGSSGAGGRDINQNDQQ
jgi:hypothetical protein